MLYYLFNYLDKVFDFPGAGLFQYISFRALAATALSILIAMMFGHKIIAYLRKKQMGEEIRDLGLQGQMEKKGTPTMGGIMIILSIVVPVLLFARLTNVYIILLLISILWTGFIGFIDDYLKKIRKNKEGLKGRFKIVGQVGLGILVGTTLHFNDSVVVRKFEENIRIENALQALENAKFEDIKSTVTTIPFFKHNELDYASLLPTDNEYLIAAFYILIATFIITAVSNGANITDGLDGLAAGTSAIIGGCLGIFAYVSGNVIWSNYLDIMYIPGTGEVVIFCAAFVGACIGFLWYNAYPAQVFMGDTGSLSLGGVIAVLALALRKELLIPVFCGIFLVENLSVIIQVGYFKYTKKKYGEGKRIFLMAPLHH
ncbi:MAG: phospho-N-acetylmuramoyl-pentapeptide-transferase, partial [Flammeovirgaceae bacterium]|nr:phospho-N-acetylmuramoyl-pentapeptide-transferase [Flammeovirgaceae bacterium]